MLACSSCERELSEDAFYPSNPRRCKGCLRAYAKSRRAAKNVDRPEGWKKKTADKAAYQRAWNAAHPGYYTKRKAEWLKANPEAEKAYDLKRYNNLLAKEGRKRVEVLTPEEKALRRHCREIWRTARKRGKVVQQPCVRCGSAKSEGHHEDYMKPLEVVWLCRPCHTEEHTRLRRK